VIVRGAGFFIHSVESAPTASASTAIAATGQSRRTRCASVAFSSRTGVTTPASLK
jgi:hypothetical protein